MLVNFLFSSQLLAVDLAHLKQCYDQVSSMNGYGIFLHEGRSSVAELFALLSQKCIIVCVGVCGSFVSRYHTIYSRMINAQLQRTLSDTKRNDLIDLLAFSNVTHVSWVLNFDSLLLQKWRSKCFELCACKIDYGVTIEVRFSVWSDFWLIMGENKLNWIICYESTGEGQVWKDFRIRLFHMPTF